MIQAEEYPAYFERYIQLVEAEQSLKEELGASFVEDIAFLQSIPEEKKDFAYDEGKWTVAQVIQHLIDVELIMAHRAFRISRHDQTSLPGFDHSAYAMVADVTNKSLAELITELKKVRDVTLLHFGNLNEKDLSMRGDVSGNSISVRALGYITIGHIKHHINLLKRSYLDNV